MIIKKREIFSTIKTEGALLPSDLLQRIAEGDSGIEGLSPDAYHLAAGEKLNEAINRSWNRLVGAWPTFKSLFSKLPESELGTSVTRERWLLPLFQELGYGRLMTSKAIEIATRSYPVSHMWNTIPIHLVGYRIDLDKRTPGAIGAARSSPHSMVQEFLNKSEDRLWAFVSNGGKLRILRDNISLTRQAYVEFDLESMMEGEVYADFVLLWLLCHESRVEAEKPEECWLERWSRDAQEQGTRALEQLRKGVEEAINNLGVGLISYPGNAELRRKLRDGELDVQDYYRQLLRIVYRLLFLFVAEDRELLLLTSSPAKARERYIRYYSMRRLRRLAERHRGTKHPDLWIGMKVVFARLGSDEGCHDLGLPALGSFLWSDAAVHDIMECDIANRDFLGAIRALAFTVENNVRRAVDYKNLGSEELGSIYEALLELHPTVNIDAGTFKLDTAAGHERKTTGSYYTPTSLITCLLDSALEPVVAEAVRNDNPEQAILNLKVCDPATGSGHFLIAAAHRLAKHLAAVRTGEYEPSPEALRVALRDVIGHCIYGVDINPMAVELCKVNLWLEALDPGKPLSFLDHHVKCGNSLLGTTPALLRKGIPDDAFKPITGDDKDYCTEFKRQNKRERQTLQTSLFTRAGKPWERLGDLASSMVNLDAIDDSTIAGVQEKQHRYESHVRSSGYLFSHFWTDAWCAAFVWKMTRDFPYPVTEEVFRRIEENPFKIESWMRDEIQRLAEQYRFFHWHLEFPDVFRVPKEGEKPENKQTGWSGGFKIVLGNPPWEKIKFQEKEWFATHRPDIAGATKPAVRRKMIRELEITDKQLFDQYKDKLREAEGVSKFVKQSNTFPLCGTGDINTAGLFAELNRKVISPEGFVGCIVPSGIVTDDAGKEYFGDMIKTNTLRCVLDFENSKGLFHGVHRSARFILLTVSGLSRRESSATFVFFAHDIDEIKNPERRFLMSPEDIKTINPISQTCPILISKKDAKIAKEIYERIPILGNEKDKYKGDWAITLQRMFDMTSDAQLFKDEETLIGEGGLIRNTSFIIDNEVWLPIIEGKMIDMYDHRRSSIVINPSNQLRPQNTLDHNIGQKCDPYFTSKPFLWASKSETKSRTLKRWCYKWYPVIKRITAATNQRTFIGCVLPECAVSYTLLILVPCEKHIDKSICLLANLNSFIADYLIRQKTAQPALPAGCVRECAVIPPVAYTEAIPWEQNSILKKWIIPRVLECSYTSHDLCELGIDNQYIGPPFKWDEERRFLIRCELDAAYFHLYEIERDDVDYIMETFPIVKRKDEQKYGSYRTKEQILEIYDMMAEAKKTGREYRTIVEPPPGPPVDAEGKFVPVEEWDKDNWPEHLHRPREE